MKFVLLIISTSTAVWVRDAFDDTFGDSPTSTKEGLDEITRHNAQVYTELSEVE